MNDEHQDHSFSAQMTPRDITRRWPHLIAHLIAESSGYPTTPDTAADIIDDALSGKGSLSEWVMRCYGGDPKRALQDAIRYRHYHAACMVTYRLALRTVRSVNAGRK